MLYVECLESEVSGFRVAEYLTAAPERSLLQRMPLDAIALARRRPTPGLSEEGSGQAMKECRLGARQCLILKKIPDHLGSSCSRRSFGVQLVPRSLQASPGRTPYYMIACALMFRSTCAHGVPVITPIELVSAEEAE